MRNPSCSSTKGKMTPCCSKEGLNRGPWTPEEDELLAKYIQREGEGRWRTLPKRAGLLRCGKSCRLRWMNYLRPSLKHGHIDPDEEDLILRLHRLLGNRWSLIAGRIPGRTDNEIKNYWNTHLSKKLISQGIDPRTHKPLNPKPNSSTNLIQLPLAPKQNSNPKPSSYGLEEKGCGDAYVVNGHNEQGTTKLDQDHNWQNSDGLTMGLENSHGKSIEEEDIQNFADDIFSSFLNSLINEDMFSNQQLQYQPSTDPLVSPSQTFGYSAIWEAAFSSSMATFKEGEQKQYFERGNK